MKKENDSQSGFFTRRLLFGLVFGLCGIFLALAGFSQVQKDRQQPGQTYQSQSSAAAAEAQSAGPGKEMNWANLPVRTPTGAFNIEATEEGDEPLSDIDPATLREIKKRVFVPPHQGEQFPASLKYSATEDKATGETPGPLAPNLIQNFASLTNADQLDGFIYTPPDTNMAAGPNHVMVTINNLVGIYSKTGTLLSRRSMADWFANACMGCAVSKYFDPRITYDPVGGHWIIIELYKDTPAGISTLLVSVSQTSDPTGSWWNYSLDAVLSYSGENTWADYPDVGFDGITAASGGAVYITTNQFTFSSNSFRTALLYILPKSGLYSGASLSYWRAWGRTNGDGTQAFTLRASKTNGNPGGEFLINSQNNGSGTVSLWRVNPTYPPTAVDWTRQSTINISSYSLPPNATQPGTTDVISTIDNRIYNAVWQNNRIYAAFTLAHNWGSGTVAAVHYLKINTLSNTAEINETFGADGLHYYSPAIATDNADNIVLVFSRSNSSEYAGARYTGRLTTDTGTQDSALLKAGTVTLFTRSGENYSRWGDYQGAAIDPSNGAKVWIYGEWAANLSGFNYDLKWGTWIGQVQFAAAPSPPVATAATNVTSNGFTANWNSSSGATGYRLDVSTSSTFSSYVSGYQDLDVGNVLSRSVTGLSASTTYYYRLRAYNAGGTSGHSNVITVTTNSGPIPPPNDQCSGAIALSNGVTRADSTVNATSTGDPTMATACTPNVSISKGVWYTFTPSANGTVTVNTCGSSYDTVLEIYTGTCAARTAIACNDDDGPSCTGQQASVSFSATAGTVYNILAANYGSSGAGGSLQIVAQLIAAPPPAPVATSATSVTSSSFTANWNTSSGATGYRLDVSTSSTFGSYVSGYQDLDVGNVLSRSVTGLNPSTTYYYRLRAYNAGGTSGNSNVITQATTATSTIQVTVQTAPAGRIFTVDGTDYSTAQTFSWIPGSSHTIATTSPQIGGTNVRYVWSKWSDNGAISHTVAPTTNKTYTATFKTQYYLTMTAGTGGTVSPASGWKNSGANVSITATPTNNTQVSYSFNNWAGSGPGSYSGTNNPAAIVMNGPITETASFTQNPVQVTVQTTPDGRTFTVDGVNYSSAQVFSWTPGSSHTIATSSPQSGGAGVRYVWSRWSDNGAISHTVAPTTNKTYTATFTTQYYLTMTAGTGGSVTPVSNWKNSGAIVSIKATPANGYSFTNWTGGGTGSYSGTNNPTSITMSGPITESAAFTHN